MTKFMTKIFFDKAGKRYAGYGGLAGASIYGLAFLISPETMSVIMGNLTSLFSPYLGTMAASYIGCILPGLILICGAAVLASSIYYVIKPDPAVKAAKLGVNLIKHAAGGFIPGGKGTVDALEEIGMAAITAAI